MPRFLNTWTGEFEWHPDPSKVTYAILSHVWRKPEEGGEQSYDDVRLIQQEVKERRWAPASLDSDLNAGSDTSMAWAPFAFISFEDIENEKYGTIFAHPGLSEKIKGFCKVAREAGFRLAWNDACCIDKSSSAELSEAINSMYEWYRLSDMCYVYLADVSDGDVPQDAKSSFRESSWHGRGWTLQELIAPERIFFLKKSWKVLGTKMGLAKTLEKITGVDFNILVGQATLDSVSVARRMSWAAARKTTRVEDRAYSLLGIFGLHMSPIYGEGGNAFLRLQEEIIKTIPDQSIFAWGIKCTLKLCVKRGWFGEARWYQARMDKTLLTSSPSSFLGCSDITTIASSSLAQSLRIQGSQVPPFNCVFTPEGVSMRLICLPLSGVPNIRKAIQGPRADQNTCADCKQLDPFDTLALLQCQERRDTDTHTPSILALPLCRSREGGRSNHTLHIGGHIHDGHYASFYRAVRIELGVLANLLSHVRPKVEDVTLLHHCSAPSVPKLLHGPDRFPSLPATASWLFHRVFSFEIAPHSIDALGTLGIIPSPLQVTRSERDIVLETTLVFHGDSRSGNPPAVALRLSLTKREGITKARFSVEHAKITSSGSDRSPSLQGSPGPSPSSLMSTPQVSGEILKLNDHNGSRTLKSIGRLDWDRRTVVYTECTVYSEGIWGRKARLLRFALEHPFASTRQEDPPSSNLWLSIDISEEHPYVPQIKRALESSSLEQSSHDVYKHRTSHVRRNVVPCPGSTRLLSNADNGDIQYASRDRIEALRKESGAHPAQTIATAQHTTSRPSTGTPFLTQPPAGRRFGWDASSGSSVSNDGSTYAEPRWPSPEPGKIYQESLRDTCTQRAGEDGCENAVCRRRDATLHAEIEQLKKRNAELSSKWAAVSSQNGVLASQMANVLTRR